MGTLINGVALDKSVQGHAAKKHICPACRKRRFVRYYNFNDKEYLPEEYGRCDRQDHCGYFLHPFEDMEQAHSAERKSSKDYKRHEPPKAVINPVDKAIVKATLTGYDSNVLVQYLIGLFGATEAMRLVFLFYVGTTKGGGTAFWQIDERLRPRTAQRIFYGANGKRLKPGGGEPFEKTQPKRLFTIEEGYSTCLFGLHQLWDAPADALIALVESEKTAVIASGYLPFWQGRPVVWMASSGSEGLVRDKIEPLRGREVVLCPDFSFAARATWGVLPMRKKEVMATITVRGEQMQKLVRRTHPEGEIVGDYESAAVRLRAIGCRVSFFDPAPELDDGSDLGDFLILQPPPPRYDKPNFSAFRLPGTDAPAVMPKVTPPPTPAAQNKALIDKRRSMGEVPFQVDTDFSNGPKVYCEDERLKASLEKMIRENDGVAYLLEKMQICSGTIAPL